MLIRLFLILILLSCSCKEEQIMPPYFEKFTEEGKKRGVRILMIPKVILTTNLKKGYQAYWDGHVIRVDTTSGTWRNFPEETMMHEYGHACLNRQHNNERLPNGMYKSVMGNYSNIQYGGWSNEAVNYREGYYYDELFNEKAGVPEWGH